ncbi:RING-type E3 ubiquitin transferase [Ranunculus cassubicifolius]
MNPEEIKLVIRDILLAALAILVAGIATIVTYSKYKSISTAFAKIQRAKILPISAISHSSIYDEDSIVIFRGQVALKSVVTQSRRDWLTPEYTPVLRVSGAKRKGVLLRETKIYMYENQRKSRISTLKGVPFVIIPSGMFGECSSLDYVNVKMEESRHPLPLTRVHCQSFPTTYNVSGYDRPASLVVERKILPLGKEITAIGKVCTMRDGTPQIKACIELPYFLSDMTKTQMLELLGLKMKIVFRTIVVFESLSMVILGYAVQAFWQHSRAFDQSDLWICTYIVLVLSALLIVYFIYFITVWRRFERIKSISQSRKEVVTKVQAGEGGNEDLPDFNELWFLSVPCVGKSSRVLSRYTCSLGSGCTQSFLPRKVIHIV